MTYAEFIVFRNVKIRDSNHKKIVKLFFGYTKLVTGNERLLPDVLGMVLAVNLSKIEVTSGCFNGVFDGIRPPYNDVDMYVRLSNGIKIYIYGSVNYLAKLNYIDIPI